MACLHANKQIPFCLFPALPFLGARLALVGSSRSDLKSTWQIIASSLLSFHAIQANPRTAIVFMASADDPAPKGNAVSSQQQQTYAHPLDIAVSL
jgi:hypothetical protein